jgi:taurine transport system substrate-binding protein
MHKRTFAAAVAAVASVFAFAGGAQAQKKELTFAHQDMLVPLRLVMESGELEKATGYKINWRMFGGGGDVIRAMASGDVQMGEVGSSPLTAAASQGQEIKLFWISADIADAEALVARNGSNVNTLADLKGKRVGVPFVSTAHYQLMAALKAAGIDGNKDLKVNNMRPPEVAAAWDRGDIDATFIWDPVLAKAKSSGKVIATSGSIGKLGFPTFEGIAVNTKWAGENADFMLALVKALDRANGEVRKGLAGWTAESPQIKAIAKWTKANPADVAPGMKLYSFPTLQEQLGAQWLGGGAAKAMTNTAQFLKEQGRVQEVKPAYADFVTDVYVKKALGQ